VLLQRTDFGTPIHETSLEREQELNRLNPGNRRILAVLIHRQKEAARSDLSKTRPELIKVFFCLYSLPMLSEIYFQMRALKFVQLPPLLEFDLKVFKNRPVEAEISFLDSEKLREVPRIEGVLNVFLSHQIHDAFRWEAFGN
jgi:hypothetical protein